MLSTKQGGNRFHFLSLWCDTTGTGSSCRVVDDLAQGRAVGALGSLTAMEKDTTTTKCPHDCAHKGPSFQLWDMSQTCWVIEMDTMYGAKKTSRKILWHSLCEGSLIFRCYEVHPSVHRNYIRSHFLDYVIHVAALVEEVGNQFQGLNRTMKVDTNDKNKNEIVYLKLPANFRGDKESYNSLGPWRTLCFMMLGNHKSVQKVYGSYINTTSYHETYQCINFKSNSESFFFF